MAIYQTGSTEIDYIWADVIGNTLDNTAGSFTSTSFLIVDTDGNRTKVTGTGFTYNAGTTAVTGGTVTGLQRVVGGTPNGEQIGGTFVNAVTFWADAGSAKLAAALSGADTFELSRAQITRSQGSYAIDGYSGGGLKAISEAGLTNDTLLLEINGASELLLDDNKLGLGVNIKNISGFTGGAGGTVIDFQGPPQPGMSLSAGNGFGALEMNYTLGNGSSATLDLTSQSLFGIGTVQFVENLTSGTASAEIKLDSGEFGGGGLSSSLSVGGDPNSAVNSTLDIVMTTASFNASGFTLDTVWNSNTSNTVAIDGGASSSNLTIIGSNAKSVLIGGFGNDSLQGGSQNDSFVGSTGNDTINGGAGNNSVVYFKLTTPGAVAIVQGSNGIVNKGGANGADHLTNVQILLGSTAGDVFYVDANEIVQGGGGFDYLIELSTGVHLTYGPNFSGISEFVSNTGANTVNFAADSAFAYLYGSTGNDTLTLGGGGGYLFGEGGTNTLTGGTNATNLLVGGQSGPDTMNGGSGTANNFYYVDGSDQVNGGGAFNTVIELAAGVTVQLGSAQYQHVQEFVSGGGTNSVTIAGTDSEFVFLYGGTGNDTLTTGSGGGYLFGEGGTNTLTGGGGTNVFIADGASGIDTMNGGTGSNLYYIDANSIVHGAGTFNNVIELQQSVSLTLGSAQLGTNVQQVILNGGTNSADFHTATTQVFLYGGAGNDTLFGGTASDFLYGGLGTNTFTFAANWGKDTIEDWTAGTNDIIDLTSLSTLGVHAVTDLTQTITAGKDVITSSHTGTNSITLLGVGSALAATSFHFT